MCTHALSPAGRAPAAPPPGSGLREAPFGLGWTRGPSAWVEAAASRGRGAVAARSLRRPRRGAAAFRPSRSAAPAPGSGPRGGPRFAFQPLALPAPSALPGQAGRSLRRCRPRDRCWTEPLCSLAFQESAFRCRQLCFYCWTRALSPPPRGSAQTRGPGGGAEGAVTPAPAPRRLCDRGRLSGWRSSAAA